MSVLLCSDSCNVHAVQSPLHFNLQTSLPSNLDCVRSKPRHMDKTMASIDVLKARQQSPTADGAIYPEDP